MYIPQSNQRFYTKRLLVFLFLSAGICKHVKASSDTLRPPSTVCAELVGLSLKSVADPGFFKLFKSSEKRVLGDNLKKRLNHKILPVEERRQLIADAATLITYKKDLTDPDAIKEIDELIYMCHMIVVGHSQKLINRLSHGRFVVGMGRNQFLTELSLQILPPLAKYEIRNAPNTYIGTLARNISNNMAKESMLESDKALLEVDTNPDQGSGERAKDVLGPGRVTSSRRSYKFKNSSPQPIHQDTAEKLRDFIANLQEPTERKKQIYMRFHGLLESSPVGGETLVKIGKSLGITKQAVSLTVIEVQTSIRSAMLEQDLTMDDFLP